MTFWYCWLVCGLTVSAVDIRLMWLNRMPINAIVWAYAAVFALFGPCGLLITFSPHRGVYWIWDRDKE